MGNRTLYFVYEVWDQVGSRKPNEESRRNGRHCWVLYVLKAGCPYFWCLLPIGRQKWSMARLVKKTEEKDGSISLGRKNTEFLERWALTTVYLALRDLRLCWKHCAHERGGGRRERKCVTRSLVASAAVTLQKARNWRPMLFGLLGVKTAEKLTCKCYAETDESLL